MALYVCFEKKNLLPLHLVRISPVKCGQDRYKNQPRPIENYEPGHSSIAEKETKQFWDDVINAFDEVSTTIALPNARCKYFVYKRFSEFRTSNTSPSK